MPIRKLLVLASALFISAMGTSSRAGGVEDSHRSPFSGGYVGIGLGPGILATRHQVNIFTANTVTVLKSDFGRVGFVGDAHLGYGHVFRNNLYLGAQIFGQGWAIPIEGNRLDRFGAAGTPTRITVLSNFKAAYGISVHPGWELLPGALLYLDLGVAFGDLSMRFFDSVAATPRTTIANLHRGSKAGFKVGLGASMAPIRHFAIGLEYFYTTYGRMSVPLPINMATTLSIAPTFRTAHFMTHGALLTLDYLFKNGL